MHWFLSSLQTEYIHMYVACIDGFYPFIHVCIRNRAKRVHISDTFSFN